MSKLELININSIHLNFLSPLTKWKILDLKSLREESEYPSHPSNFEKLIRRLEKSKVLKSFKDPWSNRKFVYLSHHGLGLVGSEQKASLSSDSATHDAKVTQITRLLLEKAPFKDSQIAPFINMGEQGPEPDAILNGHQKNKLFRMAFELEINKKSQERIKSKISYYLKSGYYDYIFYMFCHKNIYQNYKNFIVDTFGKDRAYNKIMLFYNPTIFSRKIDLAQSQGICGHKEVSLDELF
jgi:hypothetical protein